MIRKIVFAAATAAICSGAVAQNITWNMSSANIPSGSIQMHGSAIVNVDGVNYLYAVGGNTAAAGTDSTKIYYAALPATGADADLTWAEATYAFPNQSATYITRGSVGYNGRLYVVGGTFNAGATTGAAYNGIRVYQPDSTGNITGVQQEYTDATAVPAVNRLEMTAVARQSTDNPANGVLYIIGGGSTNPRPNVVQKVTIDGATGDIVGTVSTAGTLATGVGQAPSVIFNNRLYVIGGYPGAVGGLTSVQYATIESDDNLGSFSNTTAVLPEGRFDGGAVVYNGTIYVLGGAVTGNGDARDTAYRATVDPITGDITAWTADSPIPLTTATGGYRRVGAVSTPEAIYMIGGRHDANNISGRLVTGSVDSNVDEWMMY